MIKGMSCDKNWLKKMMEKEDNGYIGVGGWRVKMGPRQKLINRFNEACVESNKKISNE